jgi:hypothetical protein
MSVQTTRASVWRDVRRRNRASAAALLILFAAVIVIGLGLNFLGGGPDNTSAPNVSMTRSDKN